MTLGDSTHGVVESPSAEQRLAAAESFLRGLSGQKRCLIIAPTLSCVPGLLARVIEPGTARLGVHRHTLLSLVSQLAAESVANLGLSRLSGLSTLSLCSRVIHELGQEGKLGRFASIATRPGFARSLAASIEELRAARVEVESLERLDPELGALLSRYLRALAELKLVDRSGLFELATEAMSKAEHPLSTLPCLWLDVRLRNRREADLFGALMQKSVRSCVTLVRGDDRTEAYVTEGMGVRRVERLEPAFSTDLELLQGRLFRTDLLREPPASLERGHVRILSAPGESREAVEVVRAVLQAAAAGVPFDRQAVLLRATEAYRAVLFEALNRAGVPAYFADGVRRPEPSGRALLCLLSCADEGLSARTFAEYLSLGVAPAQAAPEDEACDAAEPLLFAPRKFERLLIDAAVIGGRARWERRIQGLCAELSVEAASLENDDPRRALLDRDVAGLRSLLSFALPILDALIALPHGGTWAAWIEALSELARLSLREPEGVCEVFAELWPLANVGPVGLTEVRQLLQRRLGEVLARDAVSPHGKVFVGSIEEGLARSFERVYVLGLAEKVFPARVTEDALVPDALRLKLGADLPTTDERVADERLLLRVAVGAARDKLLLSYPRFDLEHGRPRVPSFYGLEVLRAVDGRLPAFDELTRRAEAGAAPRMGFPAPDKPTDAIDAAEFDLSMLQVLLSSDASAQRGAARYLLSESPTLARALRFRARRWTVKRFTLADGLVATEASAARALLSSQRLAARAYSATALATFSDCPYKFYLHGIVGLSERVEWAQADVLDARQRGVLFHAVQRRSLESLRERGLLPLTASELGTATQLMQAALSLEAERTRDLCAPAIDRVFNDTLRDLEHDLTEWLSRLVSEVSFVPQRFELGFGLRRNAERDSHSQDEPVDLTVGLRLRGAIDLVEQSKLPGPDGKLELRATDHKTGDFPEERLGLTQGGRMLQPVLYALALEVMQPESRVRSGRLYYCTSRGGFAEHEVRLDGAARAAAKDLVGAIDRSIEQAFLPAAPRPKACETCAYQSVCGPYEEERVAQHKDQRALGAVFHVRGLP